MRAVPQKIRSGLVELRTKTGLLYVSPSFFERIYLLWTFRNFHRLPKEVLNRRQRELIERLCRTALVRQSAPVGITSLIGSVENLEGLPERKTETAARADNVVSMKASVASGVVSRAVGSEAAPLARNWTAADRKSGAAVHPILARKAESRGPEANDNAAGVPDRRIQPREWQLGALVACCGTLLVAGLFYLHSRRPAPWMRMSAPHVAVQSGMPATNSVPPSGVHQQNPRPLTPLQPQPQGNMAGAEKLATAPASPPLERRKPELPVLSQAALRSADTMHAERPQITELPESGFVYPTAPSANLTGTVSLKAVITPDGKVEQVDVLSGNRALARAAVQAVRQWRYRPHEVNGSAVESEANIIISFEGEDAVSISLPSGQ